MIGKNQKLFLMGRTNMIHTYAGRNHNDSSIRNGTTPMGKNQKLFLMGRTILILPMQGRTMMILQSKMEQHK